MNIGIRSLAWLILLTLVYYLQFNIGKLILKKECISHKEGKLKIYSLIVALINMGLFLKLHSNKYSLEIRELLINYIIIFMLSVSSVLDLKIMRVPNNFLRPILILVLLINLRLGLLNLVLNGLVVYLALYMVYMISRESIGGADIRILSIISLGIGYKNSIMILVYSCWICIICFAARQLIKDKIRLEKIAFVPYIYLGYIYFIYNYKL